MEQLYEQKIYNDFFYLYNPIPLEKHEASFVINRILTANKFKFPLGQDINLNEVFKYDSVNRMRFKEYFERLKNSGDQRGFSIEGFMSGIFGGKLNEIRRESWDYSVDNATIQQKHIEENDHPRVTSYKESINLIPIELIEKLKNYCDEQKIIFEELKSQIFTYDLPEDLIEIKRQILENRICFDFIVVSTFEEDRLSSYRLPKETIKTLCMDPKNVRKGKGAYDLRLSKHSIIEFGSKFEIIKPNITIQEYEDFLTMNTDKDKISKIFGKYASKVRPDILDWIASQPDEFLKNAQEIVGDIVKMKEFGGRMGGEVGEQEKTPPASAPTASPSPSSSTSSSPPGSYPAVTKWDSGVKRGSANPVDTKQKWSDTYQTTRGKANTIDPHSKWSTNIIRGKGNTLL